MRLVLALLLCFTHSLSWKTKTIDYTQNYTTFFKSTEANKAIDPNNLDEPLMNAAIFYATNEYRVYKRKPSFTHSFVLEKSATLHSSNMLKYDFFNHTDPKNKKLKTPILRIKESGGSHFTSVSENLIYSNVFILGKNNEFFERNSTLIDKQGNKLKTYSYAALARQMVADWDNSKGHRTNLKGDYDYLGCGISSIKTLKNGLKVVYATQNFGSK